MFFYLSKLVWWFIAPINILFFLMGIGVFFLWRGRLNLGKLFCSLAFLFFFVTGVLPVGHFLMTVLEERFPQRYEVSEKVDGIIVLGGMVELFLGKERNELALNDNVERVTVLVELTERYPTLPVIFSGGGKKWKYPELREAIQIYPLLKSLTTSENSIYLETNSSNTYENAVFTKEILDKIGGRKWLLVTSASHQPRSVGVFRKQGIDVIPYPVDYDTMPNGELFFHTRFISGFRYFSSALHEWLGLLAYYLTDKTSELFPAP